MKSIIGIALALLTTLSTFAQINLKDSTVSVFGYWDKNEKMSYQATIKKYELKPVDSTHSDTLKIETLTYKFDIEIIDSAAESYTIRWTNYDLKSDKLTDSFMKLSAITKNTAFEYTTDELGSFTGIKNWKEIRSVINKKLDEYKRENKETNFSSTLIESFRGMFDSKESIEAGAINEILLYHYFHGARFDMDTMYTAAQKFANLLGGEPFDGFTNFWVDTVDTAEYVTTFRSYSAIDELQLTNATFNYLTDLAKKNNVTPPSISELPIFRNESYLYSVIHESGWVTYLNRHKEVTAEGTVRADDITIELL